VQREEAGEGGREVRHGQLVIGQYGSAARWCEYHMHNHGPLHQCGFYPEELLEIMKGQEERFLADLEERWRVTRGTTP
jgi:hypothetical protein